MKLDFNKPFIDLDGEAIPESNQGKTLAGALIGSFEAKDTNVLKYFEWATKLHKLEVVDLDKADQQTLKEFIDKAQFNVLVKYQLLLNLTDAKDK